MRRDGQTLRSFNIADVQGRHQTGHASRMGGKADAPQVPGLPANAGLAAAWTWFPKVKRSDEAAWADQLPRFKWQQTCKGRL